MPLHLQLGDQGACYLPASHMLLTYSPGEEHGAAQLNEARWRPTNDKPYTDSDRTLILTDPHPVPYPDTLRLRLTLADPGSGPWPWPDTDTD